MATNRELAPSKDPPEQSDAIAAAADAHALAALEPYPEWNAPIGARRTRADAMKKASATYFFDSHGALWATCESTDPDAEAFGPRGVARRAEAEEAGLCCAEAETAWTAAMRVGRVIRATDSHEWDVLRTEHMRK